MSKYLELPVKFIGEEEAEKVSILENTGVEYNTEDYTHEASLYVNPNHITCFNETSEGNVNLTLSSGYNCLVYMKFEEFLKLVDDK